MKKHLVYCFFTLLLMSCEFKKSQVQRAGNNVQPFSDAYLPPVFANEDRIKRIKDTAPQLQQMMEAHAISNKIPGIAYGIVIDDSLVIAGETGIINLERKFPATTNSCFRIASMTKSFTAMAILKLRDEGKLSLHDPVSDYIPEMGNLTYLTSDSPTINLQNLLTMTAGLPEDNPWGDRQLNETDQMLLNLIEQGVSFSNVPFFGYEYSNTGYALLGNVVTQVSGMAYQDYIRKNILLPLGMEDTFWEYSQVPIEKLALGYRWEDAQWKMEPMLHDGSFGAMGGLITTIDDFSKYVSFHLSAWPPRNGEEIGPIKRSTIREMHTPTFPRLYPNRTDFNGDICATTVGYGFGLGIAQDCNGIISVSHGGALPGYGSNYVFFPEYGLGLMAFGNLTYTSPWPLDKIKKLLFETVGLEARELPASNILVQRQGQLAQLIQQWDSMAETDFLAENFFLDHSHKQRMASVQNMLNKAGAIQSIDPIKPGNQLRGSFNMHAENGLIQVFFTLTPEKIPKVQQLDIRYQPKDGNN